MDREVAHQIVELLKTIEEFEGYTVFVNRSLADGYVVDIIAKQTHFKKRLDSYTKLPEFMKCISKVKVLNKI